MSETTSYIEELGRANCALQSENAYHRETICGYVDTLHRLRTQLAAAEAVAEYAYHATLDKCQGIDESHCMCGLTDAKAKWQALRGGGDERPCFNCETRPRTHGQLCETCNSGAEKLLGKLGLGGGDDEKT